MGTFAKRIEEAHLEVRAAAERAALAAEQARAFLSQAQAEAFEQIIAWINKGERFCLLSGHAGTGKTTLGLEIARALAALGLPICATAPTNKATRVLRDSAKRRGIEGLDFKTAYSFNGLRLMDDAKEKYIVKGSEGSGASYGVIIADEASMLDPQLFEAFEESASAYSNQVLFVGDEFQLPPWSGKGAPAFDIDNAVRLTQIVRQAEGNPIIRLGDWFRRRIMGEPPPFEIAYDADDAPGVHSLTPGEWQTRFIRAAAERTRAGEPGEIRAVAFTNDRVDEIVQAVRRELYGPEAGPYEIGERVFAAQPWGDLRIDFEADVVEVQEAQPHPQFPDWRVLPMRIRPIDGVVEQFAYAIHPAERDRWERYLSETEREIELLKGGGNSRDLWRLYHEFKDAFTDLRSIHAITTHRSQGSTFDECFVDAMDLRDARRRGGDEYMHRLFYVAATRARTSVWLRGGL